jgi:hypothetical protein
MRKHRQELPSEKPIEYPELERRPDQGPSKIERMSPEDRKSFLDALFERNP